MNKNALGICRLCFEPVWKSQIHEQSKREYFYHSICISRLEGNIDVWESKNIKLKRC